MLAQANNAGSIFVLSLLLIGCIVGLFVAVVWFRKWMKRDDEPGGIGFTLADLRDLHKQGGMSDEEFERTKAQLVQAGKKSADRLPAPPGYRRKAAPPQTAFDVIPKPPHEGLGADNNRN